MKDQYRTISSPSRGQYKEKGSRFLAFAFPVNTEEEIREVTGDLRKQYHDARHHCYAWQLGAELERYRFNDDGEPSGSAGKPIYGQIRSRELTNILVVVVRYFGGTKLGVGGLINAYRSAAADALGIAGIVEKKVESLLGVEFSYSQMNSIMKVVKDLDLTLENQQFDLDCSLTLRVWNRHVPRVKERLSKIEGCKILYL
jgi:uncharacterized YigZ family protein